MSTPLTWHDLFETVEGPVAVAGISAAVVTSFLAGFTWWLARKTAALAETTALEITVSQDALIAVKQAESAEHQASIAQRAMEATFRPVLVNVPREWRDFDQSMTELAC